MSNISNYKMFIEGLYSSDDANKKRFQRLARIVLNENINQDYAVQITFSNDLLLEHEKYKRFHKTNSMYTYHPENVNIPVKAHFHVVDRKGKMELYAVNQEDGTAHHGRNKGYSVPSKEADELRRLGVQLKSDNILESIDYYDDSIEYDVLFLIID